MIDHEKLRDAIRISREGIAHIRAACTSMSPTRDHADILEVLCDAAESTLPKETRAECWEVRSVYAMAVGPPSFCVQVRFDALAAQRLAEELRKQRLHTCVEVRKSTHLVPA